MLDFADRFHFDAGARLALRAGVISLAARAVAHRRDRCSAPAPASCSITRHLRTPWIGGLVSLARRRHRPDRARRRLSLPRLLRARRRRWRA